MIASCPKTVHSTMWSPKRTSIVTVLTALGMWASVMRVTKARIYIVKPGGLQEALDVVTPGDTIELDPGNYFETVTTKIDGEFDNYITIQGATYEAILKGDGDNGGERIFNIEHSYYRLDHFTIDGKLDDNHFFDKCIYVHATEWETENPREIHFNGHSFRSSINGLVISNMNIRNCGDECVRLRYFITYAQIYNNVIENCGVNDYVLHTAGGNKNGEGIYIGTSSEQWQDGKNPTAEADESRFNHVFKNRFNTQGNEGVDIKEGASNNIVEDNYCTGQRDPNSACLDARGSSNIFRFNTIEYNSGTGIRFGGHTVNGYTYGVDNEAYGNEMFGNDYGGIKIMVQPQGAICENNIEGRSPETVGDASEGTIPNAPCRRTRASGDSVATLKSNSNNSPDIGDDDDGRNHPEIDIVGTDRSGYQTNEYLPVYDHLYQQDFETPSI